MMADRFLRLATAWVALLALAASATAQDPASSGPAAYTVLLQAPSVGDRLDETRGNPAGAPARRSAADLASLRRAVSRSQQSVAGAIRARGIEVVGSVENVLNAVFVRATPAQAAEIARLPGVRVVAPCRQYEPMVQSVGEIVKVAAARSRAPAPPLLGDGIKIAIIDSGLDFDHGAFRGEALGTLPDYPKGDPAYLELATNKVVAIRSYVGMLNSRALGTSTPDDNSPRDYSGHGTAVAMIAAGNPVATSAGALAGIAPNARLGVYKVFGTPGINTRTDDHAVMSAIEDAILDGMDILNLSLGRAAVLPWQPIDGACGLNGEAGLCEPLAAAAQNAVTQFGRVVVVAAGNDGLQGLHEGPALSTITSPGEAPAVITVGGVGNAASIRQTVRTGALAVAALAGGGPAPDGRLSGRGAHAGDFGDSRGCEPFPLGAFRDSIAVVDRGRCRFVDKVEHADAAGALGVVVVNQWDDELVRMALLETTDIPAFFVGRSDGAALRRLLFGTGAEVTLDPTPVLEARDWDYVLPASSRGPTVAVGPKPDLAAPADGIYTAVPRRDAQRNLFDPDGFREVSGTSFAAPAVSGAAALVWQAYPALSARQVASALISAAAGGAMDNDQPARLASVGAGVLDIEAALRPNATAVPASIGFGALRAGSLPVARRIEVASRADRPQSFRMTVERLDLDTQARVSVNGRQAVSFDLAPGASVSLEVALQGALPVPGSYEGRLRLESLGGNGTLRIPYLYVVGDNVPHDAVRISGRSEFGPAGRTATRQLLARVTDRFGVPIIDRPVNFRSTSGAVRIQNAGVASGPFGLIQASAEYDASTSEQAVVARVGRLDVRFEFATIEDLPVIDGIRNAASLSSPRGVAPGSLVTVTGSGFADHPAGTASALQASRLAIRRKGVSVAFDAPLAGISAQGRILDVDEGSVTVQVPWELAGEAYGHVTVREGFPSVPYSFQLVSEDPAIFTSVDDGVEVATSFRADGALVSLDAPVAAGGTVNLLMTGNGPVRSAPPTGESSPLANPTAGRVRARVGGRAVPVLYSGLAADLAGVYSVVVSVPADLPPGIHPVQVDVNARSSNVALLPVR